ncbi:MAG: TauD/TfdA family dioxygenase [Acidimicrobiales bacterium]|nr:TauD/TfdA family dioxygenase [Acidimicrobiales bacterium]
MKIRPITGAVGAEVSEIQLADAVDDPQLTAAIDNALVDHGVLFFRDQDLTRDQHVAFGALFGEVHIHPYARNLGPAHPEILEIQSDQIDGFLDWHVDATFEPRPPIMSILYARETPDYGGDTLFCSAAAAYDALSSVMKGCLDDLRAVHTSGAVFGRGGSYAVDPDSPQTTTVHPLVRVHEVNGRRVLYVNSQFTADIEGMHADESRLLLEYLWRHITHPRFQVRFSWRPGSVAMWDNRQVQHAVVADFSNVPGRRRMERVAVLASPA